MDDTENPKEEPKSEIEKAGEDLFHFAINRDELKWLMARLHEQAEINRETVEYELQVLKIIATGWALAYYLENSPYKQQLLARFWQQVFEFSKSLSETTGLMTGQEIDYFQVLKQRLDTYVATLEKHPDIKEPAEAIGPEFAHICGNAEDLFTRMTGAKLFMTVVCRVKESLEAVKLI
ncbi:MAG: hypothetical protein ACQERN_04310 [Thermodesulfobacteriota bacterium]